MTMTDDHDDDDHDDKDDNYDDDDYKIMMITTATMTLMTTATMTMINVRGVGGTSKIPVSTSLN